MQEVLVPEFPDRPYTSWFRRTHSSVIHKQLPLLGVVSSDDGPTPDSQRALRLAAQAHSLPVGGAGKGEKAEVLGPIPSCQLYLEAESRDSRWEVMISSRCRWFIGHPGTRPTSNTSGSRFHIDARGSAGAWEPHEAGRWQEGGGGGVLTAQAILVPNPRTSSCFICPQRLWLVPPLACWGQLRLQPCLPSNCSSCVPTSLSQASHISASCGWVLYLLYWYPYWQDPQTSWQDVATFSPQQSSILARFSGTLLPMPLCEAWAPCPAVWGFSDSRETEQLSYLAFSHETVSSGVWPIYSSPFSLPQNALVRIFGPGNWSFANQEWRCPFSLGGPDASSITEADSGSSSSLPEAFSPLWTHRRCYNHSAFPSPVPSFSQGTKLGVLSSCDC